MRPKNRKSRFGASRRSVLAFSLVEVVMAIGIVSFAFVALLGLLGNGLEMFRRSISDTVQANIAQTVINDAQTDDYATATFPRRLYFDFDGIRQTSQGSDTGYLVTVDAQDLNLPSSGSDGRFDQAVAKLLRVEVQITTDPLRPIYFSLPWPRQ